MGHFDTVTIASHQAAMNFASILYILPLSISMALTIVVGFEAGAMRYKDAKATAILALQQLFCSHYVPQPSSCYLDLRSLVYIQLNQLFYK